MPKSAFPADAARRLARPRRFPKVARTRSTLTSASIAVRARVRARTKPSAPHDRGVDRHTCRQPAAASFPLPHLSGAGGDRGACGRCARADARACPSLGPGRRRVFRRGAPVWLFRRSRIPICGRRDHGRYAGGRVPVHLGRADSRACLVKGAARADAEDRGTQDRVRPDELCLRLSTLRRYSSSS